MQFQITQIEFDLSNDGDDIPPEHVDLVQQELQEEYIGQIITADDEDDLVDEVSCMSGWCIKSIDYRHVLSDI